MFFLVLVSLEYLLTEDSAQVYPACAQINVVNGGNGNPGPTIRFPGGYSGSDPGIRINIVSYLLIPLLQSGFLTSSSTGPFLPATAFPAQPSGGVRFSLKRNKELDCIYKWTIVAEGCQWTALFSVRVHKLNMMEVLLSSKDCPDSVKSSDCLFVCKSGNNLIKDLRSGKGEVSPRSLEVRHADECVVFMQC